MEDYLCNLDGLAILKTHVLTLHNAEKDVWGNFKMIKFPVYVYCSLLYTDTILNIKVYCYCTWQDLRQKNLIAI